MTATWRSACTKRVLGGDAGPFLGGPPKIVIHDTETGLGVPGYQGGSVAPHETWVWSPQRKKLDLFQHIPHNRAAMAMKNLGGGVQTNRDGAHQVEIAGTCDKAFANRYGYFYLPAAGDDFLLELGLQLRRLAQDVGVDLVVAERWQDYPASYGGRGGTNSVRFSLSQWDNFGGICGHQHAAENLHGDPGSIDVARALKLAGDVKVVDQPDPVRPKTRGAKTAPPWPYPKDHYFSYPADDDRCHSGFYGSRDRNNLREWQAQMRDRGYDIGVDGKFGDQTAHVVRVFQQRVGFKVTGRIGPGIWKLAWEAKLGVGS